MSSSYILPDEILLIIFNLCDVYSLLQISMVCKQFRRTSYTILNRKANITIYSHLLVTSQISKKFRERCKPILSSYKSKFITHYNWKYGIFEKSEIYSKCYNFRPNNRKCIQMTNNMIWFSDDNYLFGYNRLKDGILRKARRAIGICDSPINDYTYCNNEIITGHSDGSIRHWRIESRGTKKYLQQLKQHYDIHKNSIDNMDATSQHIISTCENMIKVRKNTHEDNYRAIGLPLDNKIDYISSILFDPTGTKFAACMNYFSLVDPPSFILCDIDKGYRLMDKKLDNGFFEQLLWEDPHTILMCYNTSINKMDLRISQFIRTWHTSHSNVCFSSDNLYTFITGTQNGEILLWDQRQNTPIQVYNLCEGEDISSLQFDSVHIYAATFKNIIELDFKKYHLNHAKKKDILQFFK